MPPPQSAARRQVEFLKRQLWLIVLVVSVALGIAAASSLAQPKIYRATSKIFVSSGGTLNPAYGNFIQPLTQTMSSLLETDIIARRVIGNLALNKTANDIFHDLHVSSTPDTAILQVSYDARSPEGATQILREIGTVFTEYVRQTVGRPRPNQPTLSATVVDPAHPLSAPISPHPVRTLAFAGVIGVALGIVFGLLRDTLDERIHKREEMEELFGAPVVAVVPRSMLGRPVVDAAKGVDHRGLQAIDPLRLQLARGKSRERLIAITSGGPGEGKGAVAASIGLALALSGERVVCVDVSPNERRNLSYYLNVNGGDGAARHLEGPLDIEDALREINVEALADKPAPDVVPAQLDDRSRDSVHELAAAGTHNERGRLQLLSLGEGVFSGDDGLPAWSVADLVTELKSGGRFVIVDAPSLPSAAAFALLSVSDRALVVAQESRTTKEQATSARKALETLQVPSYGVVSIGRTATPVPPYARTRGGSAQPVSSSRVRRAR
jgi:capsular polysaccharide biosynthesis protein/MinD-like ATPase involved in chromosome partitioning or flagellar assembly